MSLVEQELLTIPEHLRSPPVFSGIRVARSLVFCVMFCRSLFIIFLLAVMLAVLLRFMDIFGVFKFFLSKLLSKDLTNHTINSMNG